MYQDTTWYRGRPRSRRHCVTWGPNSPSPKGHTPNFRPVSVVAKRLSGHGLRCHSVWRWASVQATVSLGTQLPRKKAHPNQFLARVYCDQTAGWMKTPYLVRSRPRPTPHSVRRGPIAVRERGTSAPPLFSVHVYCGHGRPSQLLLVSSTNRHPKRLNMLKYGN